MFKLKSLLSRDTPAEKLASDVRQTLQEWEDLPEPELSSRHFHVRYVIVDIATSGADLDSDRILGIAAVAVRRNAISADDALYLDLTKVGGDEALARALAVFVKFVGKAPLVTYHVPYVEAFLQRQLKPQLGITLQSRWLDLAWLLPSLFEERQHSIMPLDFWVGSFGLDDVEARRDAMANTLLLARLFLMLVVRANTMGLDTVAQLLDESKASSFLRRTH